MGSSSETVGEEYSDSCLLLGNIGEMRYTVRSSFSEDKASVEIVFPDKCKLKMESVQEHLCQKCPDKVLASLEFQKWKNENKGVCPICLVDLKTLGIYSFQVAEYTIPMTVTGVESFAVRCPCRRPLIRSKGRKNRGFSWRF